MENRHLSYAGEMFLSTNKLCKRIPFPQGRFCIKTEKLINSFFIHIPQSLWINYRQELMFAVISRMWFFRFSSPLFSMLSTLLMEYRIVE